MTYQGMLQSPTHCEPSIGKRFLPMGFRRLLLDFHKRELKFFFFQTKRVGKEEKVKERVLMVRRLLTETQSSPFDGHEYVELSSLL